MTRRRGIQGWLIGQYRNTKPVYYRRKGNQVAIPDYTDPKVIEEIFTYHPPTEEQKVNYQQIRDGAKAFALILAKNTPKCADQSTAIRLLRECVMTANASVALKGLV